MESPNCFLPPLDLGEVTDNPLLCQYLWVGCSAEEEQAATALGGRETSAAVGTLLGCGGTVAAGVVPRLAAPCVLCHLRSVRGASPMVADHMVLLLKMFCQGAQVVLL